MKLRDQLLARCLTAAALAFGLFGATLIWLAFTLQLDQTRSVLIERSASTARAAEAAAVNYALQGIALTDELLPGLLPASGEAYGLFSESGAQMAGEPASCPDGDGIFRVGRSLVLRQPVSLCGTTFYLVASADLEPVFEMRRRLLIGYALAYPALTALFFALMSQVSRRTARPIEQLAGACVRIAGGNAEARAMPGGCAETVELADAFNRMADALTGQIERQQRFIADLTHEMKTPLAAVIGHADLIRSSRLSAEETLLAAHRIVREGERLNALSARLIDLILLQNDEATLAPVFAPALVADAVDALRPIAEERGVCLSGSCDEVWIEGDPALLRALLANLIDNALKSGGSRVSVVGSLANSRLALTVCDDGRGMNGDALKHIAEPFYRVDKSRSRSQGGAGLGLSLCAEIARVHHARLTFESAPGQGCRVSIELAEKEAPAVEKP